MVAVGSLSGEMQEGGKERVVRYNDNAHNVHEQLQNSPEISPRECCHGCCILTEHISQPPRRILRPIKISALLTTYIPQRLMSYSSDHFLRRVPKRRGEEKDGDELDDGNDEPPNGQKVGARLHRRHSVEEECRDEVGE
jgi:hypothetical protein